jgi:Ca-activated chloride channel family protein
MKRMAIVFLALLFVVSCTGSRHSGVYEISYSPPPPPLPPQFNTEAYNLIEENGFLDAVTNPLSTFSIDVDAASYSNVRRFINENKLPPKDAVRIEELINYFSYDYPLPGKKYPFSIATEISECPWNDRHKLVHIGLQARCIDADELPPSNLVFLLDVSGSMGSPDKLPLLKKAFRLLTKQMRREDQVAIAVYAGAAGLVLPPCPGHKKGKILKAIDRLQAGGSTAGASGIQLAYNIAQENFIESGNNRVILATDGDFNVGVSSDAELVRLIEEKRESGVYLTVLGFGTGNLKDSKMEQLADKGNGNYAYIDNIREAKKVLVNEMGATLHTVAKDVKVQVEFNPARVGAYRLIGYENRLLDKEDFADDTKDAGEMGAGHTVTALYEIIPKGTDADVPRVDPLKYSTTGIKPEALESPEMMTIQFRYKLPDEEESRLLSMAVADEMLPMRKSSDNFRFSAAVAEFGMLLRDSKFKGNATYEDAYDLANGALGDDEEGYRAEFIEMVESCAQMNGKMARRVRAE